ncbi:MAG: hypothetical protein ACXAC7_21150, partial [Candidatus Hodarchaeales archaeon]
MNESYYSDDNIRDFFPKSSASPEAVLDWDELWGYDVSNQWERSYDMVIDSNDSIYLAGSTSRLGNGGYDMIIIKYNNSGTELWNSTWGWTGSEEAIAIALDIDGNIIVAGYTTSFTQGLDDICLVKFNKTGGVMWNVTWGGVLDDNAASLKIDSENSIIVSGITESFGGSDQDICFIKYNNQGVQIWNTTWGGSQRDTVNDMILDSENNIYVCGDTLNFGRAENDVLLAKFNSSGNNDWAIAWDRGVTAYESGNTLRFDNDGDILIIGFSFGAFYGILLFKYDTSGSYIWDKYWQGAGGTLGCQSFLLDSSNNIYGGFTYSTGGNFNNISLVKFNSSGDFQWQTIWDYSDRRDGCSAIAYDSANNFYLSGSTGTTESPWKYMMVLLKYNNTQPRIIIDKPKRNDVFGSNSPNFNISVYEFNINTTWYTIDNGINNYTFTGNNGKVNQLNWTSAPDGVVNLTFFVNNSVGALLSNTISIIKDTSAPIININYPLIGNFSTNPPNYNIKITDLSLEEMWYTLNGSNLTFFSNNGTINQTKWLSLSEGNITIRFFANDSVGQTSFNDTIVKKDTIKPTIQVLSPNLNDLLGIKSPNFTVRINDTNLDTMWYSLNGGFNQTFINNETFRTDWWNNLPNGTVDIRFYANDSAGNEQLLFLTIRIKKFNPVVNIISPLLAQKFNGTAPNFIVQINDTHLNNMWYRFNGSQPIFFISNGSFNQNNWTVLTDGFINITFYANDTAGNLGFDQVIVEKDSIGPTIQILSPTVIDILGTNTPNFIVRINDTNLDKMWYSLNGGFNQTFSQNETFRVDWWSSLPNGTVSIRFYANDSVSNENVNLIIVKIEIYLPTIIISTPISFAIFNETGPNFIVRMNDTNLDKMWYTLNSGDKIFFITNSTIDQNNWTIQVDGLILINFYA